MLSSRQMPLEIRVAIADALDQLKQPALSVQIQARAVRKFERKVTLTRRSKKKMMALLKLASRGSPDGSVRDWVEELGLSLIRLPIDDVRAVPPGAIVEYAAGTSAVMGFGGRLYPSDPRDRVLGVWAPT
jgi:hypothetical protein